MNDLTSGLLLLLTALLVGCSDPKPQASTQAPSPSPVASQVQAESSMDFISQLSPDDAEALALLQARGSLGFALRISQDSYQPQSDGSIKGFDYHFALAFAEAIGVRPHFELVNQIAEFYADHDGFNPEVITNTSLSYQPSLFSRVDILAAPLAVNAWRQRLSHMVPMFPVGVAIVGPNAGQIQQYSDLNGLAVAVRTGDFQRPLINAISEQHGIELDIQEHQYDRSLAVFESGFDGITLDGSLFLAREMQEAHNLEIAPLRLSLVSVAWAVNHDDPALQLILSRFIDYSLNTGLLPQIWSEQMGVDFGFYLSIVGNP